MNRVSIAELFITRWLAHLRVALGTGDLLVRHGGQIVDPVGHAGDSRCHEIERFAQIIVGEGRVVGLVWHREGSLRLLVLRDEQPLELGIGVVTQLLRHCGGLPLYAQKLVFRAELHDFIGGQ